MAVWLAAMCENLVIVAARLFECIAKCVKSIEGIFIVYALCDLSHQLADATRIHAGETKWVADDFTDQVALSCALLGMVQRPRRPAIVVGCFRRDVGAALGDTQYSEISARPASFFNRNRAMILDNVADAVEKSMRRALASSSSSAAPHIHRCKYSHSSTHARKASSCRCCQIRRIHAQLKSRSLRSLGNTKSRRCSKSQSGSWQTNHSDSVTSDISFMRMHSASFKSFHALRNSTACYFLSAL